MCMHVYNIWTKDGSKRAYRNLISPRAFRRRSEASKCTAVLVCRQKCTDIFTLSAADCVVFPGRCIANPGTPSHWSPLEYVGQSETRKTTAVLNGPTTIGGRDIPVIYVYESWLFKNRVYRPIGSYSIYRYRL